MKLDIEMDINKDNVNAKVQTFGRFLSGMVMPNIGAFIAWGLFTAFFIESGWLPNKDIAIIIDPMIRFLIPILIGYTGGKMIHGQRGGVVASVATLGLIVGTDLPMILGAMILGPTSGLLIKKADALLDKWVRSGFEMLVSNITAGIIGGALAIFSIKIGGSTMTVAGNIISSAVSWILENGFTPFTSILIEPSKILFLNNAINHGVLSPLGVEQTLENGKSILFLLETNPGPGLGVLLLFLVQSKGAIRKTTPTAMIIHFFGGIHEIYFPYVYMKPALIIPLIFGGASGIFVFGFFNTGLVAVPSPGSIFTVLAYAPREDILPILLGVLISAAVTFFTGTLLFVKKEVEEPEISDDSHEYYIDSQFDYSTIKKIVVSCDAGMGSSALGAGKLKALLKKNQMSIEVINCPIEQIPMDADLIITHEALALRAKKLAPHGHHITTNNFLLAEFYNDLLDKIQEGQNKAQYGTDRKVILQKSNIHIGLENHSIEEAIRNAGQALQRSGYIAEAYIDSMLAREAELPTYVGSGVIIPHGHYDARGDIHHTGISILQYPAGIPYDGEMVYLVIGIAGKDNDHLKILSNLAEIIQNEAVINEIISTKEIDYIYKQFTVIS